MKWKELNRECELINIEKEKNMRKKKWKRKKWEGKEEEKDTPRRERNGKIFKEVSDVEKI